MYYVIMRFLRNISEHIKYILKTICIVLLNDEYARFL